MKRQEGMGGEGGGVREDFQMQSVINKVHSRHSADFRPDK